jgi:hypothetical protein
MSLSQSLLNALGLLLQTDRALLECKLQTTETLHPNVTLLDLRDVSTNIHEALANARKEVERAYSQVLRFEVMQQQEVYCGIAKVAKLQPETKVVCECDFELPHDLED